MANAKVPRHGAEQLHALLDSPEVQALILDLQETRWTGRPGYPVRAMVGVALVKALYAIPTWTRVVRLVAEHAGLTLTLGAVPSVDACYRFAAKLRRHQALLDRCTGALLAQLHAEHPDMGTVVAL